MRFGQKSSGIFVSLEKNQYLCKLKGQVKSQIHAGQPTKDDVLNVGRLGNIIAFEIQAIK